MFSVETFIERPKTNARVKVRRVKGETWLCRLHRQSAEIHLTVVCVTAE